MKKLSAADAVVSTFVYFPDRYRNIPVVAHRKGTEMAECILRRPEVETRTGLSRSTIYEWMKRGEFPTPVALGARLVGWRESEIEAWLKARATKGA